MIYENDKLNIPESYRKMSVSELRQKKELVYSEIKKNTNNVCLKTPKYKKTSIAFHF